MSRRVRARLQYMVNFQFSLVRLLMKTDSLLRHLVLFIGSLLRLWVFLIDENRFLWEPWILLQDRLNPISVNTVSLIMSTMPTICLENNPSLHVRTLNGTEES